ncbi:tetratricopeptide repeat protein [Flavobacterium sp. UBA6135]|uniref:tetratricopeptide repeat protein n=1 Tax=Flavobacterium sp. UBA6135 TaxID=1946553 RepID=UPI0025B914DE|nr:tetratricopeptide repeat protein [Flavobacterium sp. UBA6135]
MKDRPSFILLSLITLILFFSCSEKPTNLKFFSTKSLFNDSVYVALNTSQQKKHLDSLSLKISSFPNDSITRNDYLKIAVSYYYLDDYNSSYNLSKKVLNLSKAVNDSVVMAKAFYYLGDTFELNQRDSAYYYYLKAEKIYENLNDDDNTAGMKFNKAYMLFYSGNYSECEVEVSKALHLLQSSKKHDLKYNCLTLLANCLEKLEDYKEAFEYHKKALDEIQVLKKNGYTDDQITYCTITSTVNLCNLHEIKGEYNLSINKLLPLTTINIKNNWPYEYTVITGNLANAYMKSGDLEKAYPLLLTAMKMADSLNNQTLKLYNDFYVADYYELKKDTTRVVSYLKKAYTKAVVVKSNDERLKALRKLTVYAPDKKHYNNEYLSLTDSITKQQRKTKNQFARIEYETAQLENDNRLLSKQNLHLLYFLVGLGCIFIGFFIKGYINKKNKELAHLKEQKLANDELFELLNKQQEKITQAKEFQKAEIAKELHDNIMNRVYAVRMGLGAIITNHEESAVEKKKRYINHLHEIENEIRELSHSLKITNGFEKAQFTNLVEEFTKDNNNIGLTLFKYECDDPEKWNAISNISKIHIYRILQEWIANVHKHAQATLCSVTLTVESEKNLTLIISDNGIGITENPTSKGIGMVHLKERIQLIGAHYKIESTSPSGTQLMITYIH